MSRAPTLTGAAPAIIAHRGASGRLPEHTLAGYALALAQGADVIEPDLVPSADGVLYCRHDLGLARSTDVATRAPFADRVRDGDWPVLAFSADELDTLRARQPFPGRDPSHDGQHPPPRFAAAIDWAASAAQARGRRVVLYPEIKHPAWLAEHGVDPVPLFVEQCRALPDAVDMRVQCFDVAALRRLFDGSGLPCTLLLDADADWQAAIAAHAGWLAALGVNKKLLWRDGTDSGLVAAAHGAGLRVDAWTYRDDQPGHPDGIEAELEATMRLGVDGLFCDFPDTALTVRARLLGEPEG